MSTPEFHYRVGRYVAARRGRTWGSTGTSLLAAAYRYEVPIYTSSPGDSSIGMNVAALALEGSKLAFDVSADVNLSAAIVWDAKATGGKSACWILGGGSPKNFMLQTEPQIQEVLGLVGSRARLLPAGDRRSSRHRRPLGRHSRRGRLVGQGRSGEAP